MIIVPPRLSKGRFDQVFFKNGVGFFAFVQVCAQDPYYISPCIPDTCIRLVPRPRKSLILNDLRLINPISKTYKIKYPKKSLAKILFCDRLSV